MSNWYKMSQQQKKLYIMRSPPGAGKSTLAKELGKNGVVYSSDDFFMRNGKYIFDIKQLHRAHLWNQQRTERALQQGISPVVIDNTNIKFWEMKEYVKLGIKYGYEIEFVQPNWHKDLYISDGKWNFEFLKGKNVHGVPDDILKKKIEQYDYDPTVEKVLKSKASWENNKLI